MNAWKVQQDFRAAQRISSEDTGEYVPKRKRQHESASGEAGPSTLPRIEKKKKGNGEREERLRIREGETVAEFNRRVEAALRPGVAQAMKTASAAREAERAADKEAKAAGKGKGNGKAVSKDREKGKDESADEFQFEDRPVITFAEKSQRKRLNDIVQAPPTLPHLRKSGQSKDDASKGAFSTVGRVPLSLAQRRQLDEERQRVIELYRGMKVAKEQKRVEERDAEERERKAQKGNKDKDKKRKRET